MRLYSLGDSHAVYTFAGVAGAKLFWRGPITMHRAARDGISALVPRNCRPKKRDILILSFGEIDSRAHIKKHAQRNGSTTLEEADKLCSRFKSSLDEFRSNCNAHIALSCIVPFNPKYLEYNLYADDEECLIDAMAIRARMNENMSSMDVPFVDFHAAFSNNDGSIKSEMSDQNHHIDSRCTEPVIQALKNATNEQFTLRELPWPDILSLAELPYQPHYKRIKKIMLKATRPLRRKFTGPTL